MSFTGRWTIEIPTPIGKQEIVLDIVEENGAVRGMATSRDETVPFGDPVVEGDRIRWSQRITKPMKMNVKFDLTRTGDALAGTSKPGILPAIAINGRRSD